MLICPPSWAQVRLQTYLRSVTDRSIALLVGFNGTGHKGILLLGRNLLVFRNFPGANILSLVAIYLTGSYGSSLSTIYAYNASNTSGHTKKSTINAITLVAFSVGNIIGAEIFLPKDAPDYVPGKITILVLFSVQLVVVFLLRWINQRTSKKKLAHVEVIKRQRGWTDEDIQGEKNKYAFADLTDKECGCHSKLPETRSSRFRAIGTRISCILPDLTWILVLKLVSSRLFVIVQNRPEESNQIGNNAARVFICRLSIVTGT